MPESDIDVDIKGSVATIIVLQDLNFQVDYGLQEFNIITVTTLASMLYASPAWWGYTTAQDRDRIERLMSRLRRGGYLPPGPPSYEVLAGKADERLLKSITSNPSHVLRKYLPKLKNTGHN